MSFEKKKQNEVKIFGCVFSLVIIQGKLIRRVMTPISRTYIFDKSTDDFFMKFYRARETDGSASQTFDSGSQGQIQGKITGKDHRCAVGTKMQNGTFCM